MTCASKTQASPAWAEGGASPPLAIDAFKKHFCYPLERKIVSKASRERTWVGGANSGRAIPAAWAGSLLTVNAAGSRFCPEARALSQVPCCIRHSVLGEGGKGWTRTG